MKTKRTTIFLIICALLCAALLFSVVSLISAKSEVKELEAEILALAEEKQQLVLLNQLLQTQMSGQTGGSPDGDFYCALSIDDWSQKNGTLTVDAFAEAFLPVGSTATGRIELWRGSAVIASQPVALTASEVDGAFEAEASLSFNIPALEAEEELELWLIVESPDINTLFTCGAGWYAENGQLMIIAG